MAGYVPALDVLGGVSKIVDTLDKNDTRRLEAQKLYNDAVAANAMVPGSAPNVAPPGGGNIFGNLLSGAQKVLTPPPAPAPALTSIPAPVGGPAPPPGGISGSILKQESGGNPNVATSIDGAQGIGQIMPSTFAAYAKPGERIDNPNDNLAVHKRIVDDYSQRYGGDPARVAVAYFSGPGNVAPPGSPTPWINDRTDGNGKSVSSYVSDVTGRLKPAGGVQLAGAVPSPDTTASIPTTPAAPEADGGVTIGGRTYTVQDMVRMSNNPYTKKFAENLFAIQQRNLQSGDTAEIKNFKFAQQNGFTGNFQDYQKSSKAPLVTIDQGVSEREAIANRMGLKDEEKRFYILNGKLPTQAEKAPTEGQANAALYADRMAEANKIISDPTIQATTLEKWIAPIPVVGNYLVSEEKQRIDQAKTDFINAVLRRESGAAIGQSEFASAERQYFPQPGDGPKVIAQKQKNRETALAGIANAAGPAYAKKLQAARDAASSPPAGPSPAPGPSAAPSAPPAAAAPALRYVPGRGFQ